MQVNIRIRFNSGSYKDPKRKQFLFSLKNICHASPIKMNKKCEQVFVKEKVSLLLDETKNHLESLEYVDLFYDLTLIQQN